MPADLDTFCINTIRTLSIDAIERANSGHPGTPMAMAPVAYTLWQRFLDQVLSAMREQFGGTTSCRRPPA